MRSRSCVIWCCVVSVLVVGCTWFPSLAAQPQIALATDNATGVVVKAADSLALARDIRVLSDELQVHLHQSDNISQRVDRIDARLAQLSTQVGGLVQTSNAAVDKITALHADINQGMFAGGGVWSFAALCAVIVALLGAFVIYLKLRRHLNGVEVKCYRSGWIDAKRRREETGGVDTPRIP